MTNYVIYYGLCIRKTGLLRETCTRRK